MGIFLKINRDYQKIREIKIQNYEINIHNQFK